MENNENFDLIWNEDENNYSDDIAVKNSLLAYFKEMDKYPLLTPEEEVQYGKMLKNPQNKKLLVLNKIDGYTVSTLNIPLLFNSLCDNPSYKGIITKFIAFYGKLNSNNDKVVEVLQKYQTEAAKLNRALNHDELKEIFNIDTIDNSLNAKDLLVEMKKFIYYKYAFDKMYVSNLKLVVSIAKDYQAHMEMLDLINEGNLGLMRAIDKYDVSLGNKFSTYAVWWIKQSMIRAISHKKGIIRLPENRRQYFLNLRKQIILLEQQEKRSLSMEEIAQKLSIDFSDIWEYQMFMQDELSLDMAINEDENMTLKDLIPNDTDLEDMVLDKFLLEDINNLLEVLNDREKQVIKMRFGLGEYRGTAYTVQRISESFSLSKQRISQIEQKALFKMKRHARYDAKTRALREYSYH